MQPVLRRFERIDLLTMYPVSRHFIYLWSVSSLVVSAFILLTCFSLENWLAQVISPVSGALPYLPAIFLLLNGWLYFHLDAFHRSISLSVEGFRLVSHRGVFVRRAGSVPICAFNDFILTRGIIDRLLGTSSLQISSFFMEDPSLYVLPFLEQEDAAKLCLFLEQEGERSLPWTPLPGNDDSLVDDSPEAEGLRQ